MEVGVIYPQIELGGQPEAAGKFAVAAEELGYSHLYFPEHVLGVTHESRNPPLPPYFNEKNPFHDPFVTFAYLSGITSRIVFGTSVLILPQRQAVLVARQAADLSLISDGRFRMGIGTGWNYVEYQALGVDYATRGARMDEQVTVLRSLWSEPQVSFVGGFHQLDRVTLIPRPRIPIEIWMGGKSEVAWRRAARAGDGFMFVGDVERSIHGRGRIQHYRREAGRDPDAFNFDFTTASASPDKIMDASKRWRDAGGTHLTLGTMGRGLTTVEAHIEFIEKIKARLDAEL